MSDDSRVSPVGDRIGFLLKRSWHRLAELTGPALAPLGIDGRDLAVLTMLARGAPPSQQEAAARLWIDRTTMVGLIDDLEAKGLVERSPDPADRRRNTVVLTAAGRRTLVAAAARTDEAEERFLAPLDGEDRERLRRILRTLTVDLPDEP